MSVVSGVVQAVTGKKAAEDQADAANKATDVQWKIYKQNREDLAPWREAGKTAVNELLKKVQAGPGTFNYKTSPGYGFRLSEGTKAIDRSAAAKGGALSGATMKALNKYAQNYAYNDYNTEYNNFLSRYYQSLTPYQSLAGLGQTATMAGNNDATNTANAIGQNYQNAAAANASGNIGAANALSNASSSAVSNGLQAYYLWKNYGNAAQAGGAATATQAEEAAAML